MLSLLQFPAQIQSIRGSNVVTNLLSEISSAEPSSDFIQNFTIPTRDSGPNAIVSGPNGTMWFVEFTAGKIGEFFTANDSFHEFPIPEAGAVPASLAIDQFGNVWFSDQKSTRPSIWSLDPAAGKFYQYSIPTAGALPLFILIDSQHNVWFTETTGYKIGELVYPTYSLKEYPVPISQFEPLEMALNPRTATLWVTLAETTSEVQPGMIASFNLTSEKFQQLYRPPFSLEDPVGIVLDKNGNVWVSEHRASSITELIPSNSTWRKYQTSLPPPSFQLAFSAPATLTIDNTGNLWFVEHFSNRVGILNPSTGIIREFDIPGPPGPYAYSVLNTLDTDGNFWFTNFGADSINMISKNVTTNISTQVSTNLNMTVGVGQSTSVNLQVKNLAPTAQTLFLNTTSSFSLDGNTSPKEVSFNVTDDSLQLASGQSEVVKVTIAPDDSLTSGIYSISVIFGGVNSSTIQTFFIRVNASPLYFFYHIGNYYQDILLGAIAIVAVLYLVVRRGTRRKYPVEKIDGNKAKSLIFIHSDGWRFMI